MGDDAERKRRPSAAWSGLLGLVAILCIAAAASDAALLAVRRNLASATSIVRSDVSRSRKVAGLEAVARRITDTETMGRRALGNHLRGVPRDQREEFFTLFDELLIRTYIHKLLFFKDPRFGYRAPVDRDGGVLVQTKIITPKDEFYVDYAMAERDGRWVAEDIVVEGNSLTRFYAFQFDGILANRSFEELLELMRRKTGVLRGQDEP